MTKNTIVQYRCDRCFKVFDSEKLAIACESSHVHVDDMRIVRTKHWNPIYKIPNNLELVVGQDNKIFVYEFKEII